MNKPNFLGPSLEKLDSISEEPSYSEKIAKVEGQNKILKNMKTFSSVHEAETYIGQTPSRSSESLREFVPETDYIIGDGNVEGDISVYAYMEHIEGDRLDTIDSHSMNAHVIGQFDLFLSRSLEIYEREGVCPGVNLKNFIVDGKNKLWYVDSEPYPENNHEPFELAHARDQRLKKMFGDSYSEKFPKTSKWIAENKADNYKQSKTEAQKLRKNKTTD